MPFWQRRDLPTCKNLLLALLLITPSGNISSCHHLVYTHNSCFTVCSANRNTYSNASPDVSVNLMLGPQWAAGCFVCCPRGLRVCEVLFPPRTCGHVLVSSCLCPQGPGGRRCVSRQLASLTWLLTCDCTKTLLRKPMGGIIKGGWK